MERSGVRERSNQCGASERVSSTSECAKRRASGPVIQSVFLVVLAHSALLLSASFSSNSFSSTSYFSSPSFTKSVDLSPFLFFFSLFFFELASVFSTFSSTASFHFQSSFLFLHLLRFLIFFFFSFSSSS